MQVVSSRAAPELLPQLRDWFLTEWGDVDPFDLSNEEPALPPPLLAIGQGRLLGGLMFSSFRAPGGDEPGLWINALFVRPDQRRKGIASELIRAAERNAAGLGHERVFALTDIPKLYLNLGWEVVETTRDGTVVGASLAGS